MDIADAFLAGSVAHRFLDNHGHESPLQKYQEKHPWPPEYTIDALSQHRMPASRSGQEEQSHHSDRNTAQQYGIPSSKGRFLEEFDLSSSQTSTPMSYPPYRSAEQPMAFRGLASSSSFWDTSSEEGRGVRSQEEGLDEDARYAL